MRARQAEAVAQEVHEEHPRLDVDLMDLAVHGKAHRDGAAHQLSSGRLLDPVAARPYAGPLGEVQPPQQA
jgi:hypothetical protein